MNIAETIKTLLLVGITAVIAYAFIFGDYNNLERDMPIAIATPPVSKVVVIIGNKELIVKDTDKDGNVDIVTQPVDARYKYALSGCSKKNRKLALRTSNPRIQKAADNLMKAGEELRQAIAEDEQSRQQTTKPQP